MTDEAAPVIVEVSRGGMAESRHRCAVAVVDSAGRVIRRAGDIDRLVYPRSAIKPLQALAMVETGAAQAFGLGDAEIALACASHSGEPLHAEAVRDWLGRIGCAVKNLECGAHPPVDDDAAKALSRSGSAPTAAHNNCSGKHAGFLTTARHLGHEIAGYSRYEHPVQQRVLGILEAMTGLDLGAAPRGIDGCGIPVIGIPLVNVALAMARLGVPEDQPEERQAAAARIRAAMAAEPWMVGGTGRFDTRVIAATEGRVLVKLGAEGIHCATIAADGIGIALKVDDGARRAAEVAMSHTLRSLGVLSTSERAKLSDLMEPAVVNWAGAEVGRVRVISGTLGMKTR